jgi:hypothetical protein
MLLWLEFEGCGPKKCQGCLDPFQDPLLVVVIDDGDGDGDEAVVDATRS